MKRKRMALPLWIGAFILLMSVQSGVGAAYPVHIEGYVYDPCGGCFSENRPCKPCTVVLQLESYLYDTAELYGAEKNTRITVYNTLLEEGRERLAAKLEIPTTAYPVVFINDAVFCGWEEIKNKLPAMLGQQLSENTAKPNGLAFTRGKQNAAVYFKAESCGQCKKTDEWLKTIQPTGDYTVEIYDISENKNAELLRSYAEIFNLQPEEVLLPIVFVGDVALEGFDEIELLLETALNNGSGYQTPMVDR